MTPTIDSSGLSGGTSRRARKARIAVFGAIVAAVLIWVPLAARDGYGFGGPCRSFWGESFQAGAWSPSGGYLSAYATASDGKGHARVFRWPGMGLVNEASAYMDASEHVPVDDEGTIYWTVSDPFDGSASTVLWRKRIGAGPEVIPSVSTGPVLNEYWAAGGLVVTEYDSGPPERWRLTRLVSSAISAQPFDSSPWSTTGSDLWIDRSGEWTVRSESDVANAKVTPLPEDFIVRHGDQEWRLRLPGYGGRVPTLTPDHSAVMYQRSETARLTLISLATGSLLGEVDSGEFFGGELSANGILATATAVGPWEDSDLCVIDVASRLGG